MFRRSLCTFSAISVLMLAAASRGEAVCTAGVEVGGACWFLGGLGQSCADVCAAAGLPYDQATSTFAGSDGSTANCFEVLEALGAPPIGGAVSPIPCDVGSGLGCGYEDDPQPIRIRCLQPTTVDSANATVGRACACRSALGAPAASHRGLAAAIALLAAIAWSRRRSAGRAYS